MQELINRIVENIGLDSTIAEKAIGIILNTLKTEVPEDKLNPLLQALPGAQDLLVKFQGESSSDNGDSAGSFLSGAIGGLMGGSGIMDALSKLQAEGLNIDQVKSLGQEVFNFAEEKAGEDVINEVKKAIPGLSQLL